MPRMLQTSDGFRVLEIRVIAGFAGTRITRNPTLLPAGFTRKNRVLPAKFGYYPKNAGNTRKSAGNKRNGTKFLKRIG